MNRDRNHQEGRPGGDEPLRVDRSRTHPLSGGQLLLLLCCQ